MRLATTRRALAAVAVLAAAALPAPAVAVTPPAGAAVAGGRIAGGHVAAAPRASLTGLYRLQLAGPQGTIVPAHVIVEQGESAVVQATLLLPNGASALGEVRIAGDALSATASTDRGRGELTLRVQGTTVSGTFVVGRTVWQVTGARSS